MMTELLRLLPEVKRARGWRLYTDKGRLVDLWQYGGRALLGHTPPGLVRAVKNSAERGLFAPFPHFSERRLLAALALLLPGRAFRLYQNESSLRAALASEGFSSDAPFFDPALTENPPAPGQAVLWRPYLDPPPPQQAAVIPVLPIALSGAPAVLALAGSAASAAARSPAEVLSPVAAAATTRSIYDLLAAPERPQFRKVEKALRGNSFWKRRGIYLYINVLPPSNYEALFRRFLEGGFLLPPGQGEPLILPGELSPGEESALAALLAGED
jgi:hypothetical protein